MPEILNGNLDIVSLPSIVQLLEAEALTGWLRLGDDTIGFSAGKIVTAKQATLDGITAVLELFIQPAPRFAFETDRQVEGQPLGSVLGLIMEGCRLADEWRRISDWVLSPAGQIESSEAHMLELLPHLRGRSPLIEAVRLARVPRASVLDPVLGLLADGLLQEVTQPPSPVREAVPDYYAAVELGRNKMREGAFDAAEAAFLSALDLRPDDRIAAQNLRRVRQLQSPTDSTRNFAKWFRSR